MPTRSTIRLFLCLILVVSLASPLFSTGRLADERADSAARFLALAQVSPAIQAARTSRLESATRLNGNPLPFLVDRVSRFAMRGESWLLTNRSEAPRTSPACEPPSGRSPPAISC